MNPVGIDRWPVLLRGAIVGSLVAFAALYAALYVWGWTATHITLPAFRWLSVNGYLTKGSPVNAVIHAIPAVLGVAIVAVAFGWLGARLAKCGPWIAETAAAMTFIVLLTDWSGDQIHYVATDHWFV